jgi:hypothetical protein
MATHAGNLQAGLMKNTTSALEKPKAHTGTNPDHDLGGDNSHYTMIHILQEIFIWRVHGTTLDLDILDRTKVAWVITKNMDGNE